MNDKKHTQLDAFAFSFKEIWKFDKRLFFVLLIDVIVTAAMPFPSTILSGLIVDGISAGDDFTLVALYVVLMFGISFFLNAITTYLRKTREYLFVKFSNKLNNDINSKCMRMDYERFNDSSFQDRIRLINQMSQGNNFFTNIVTMFQIVSQVITLLGMTLILSMMSGWLLLIALVVMVLQSVLHIIKLEYDKQFQVDTINEQRKLDYVSSLAKDTVAKKDVDMFCMSGYITDKIKAFQKNMLVFNMHRIKMNGFIEIATFFLSVVFQLSAYLLMGIRAMSGQISVGDFTIGIASLINFMSASSFVATNILNLNNNLFYVQNFKSFRELKSKSDNQSTVSINDLDLNNIEIEFRNVSFRYPNSTSFVLKNINLKLSNKEKFAVVGYNGAGKTSFVLLLTRMYDPTEGSIYLNGIDIREINYNEYLKIFSTVNQDFFLLPFSLLENIALEETVTSEQRDAITELCYNNGMGERLQRMYKRLDTPITKSLFASGIDLSGGERQKVAIIRALYKNSSVLILDEPTAALDPVAEYEIYRKFAEMSEGKLTVYISHRIYSTRFCDKIAVFEKGEIKEYGTFEELMALKGLYYDFYQTQAEFFL